MTRLLLALRRAASTLRLADLRAHGHAPDKVIHRPGRLGAKPTRYQPAPGCAPDTKRRRQWR